MTLGQMQRRLAEMAAATGEGAANLLVYVRYTARATGESVEEVLFVNVERDGPDASVVIDVT